MDRVIYDQRACILNCVHLSPPLVNDPTRWPPLTDHVTRDPRTCIINVLETNVLYIDE